MLVFFFFVFRLIFLFLEISTYQIFDVIYMYMQLFQIQAHIYIYSTSLGIWNEIQKIKLCTDFFIVPLTVFFIFFCLRATKEKHPQH